MLAGRVAALAGATAMIDISDGLVMDLGRVADASEVTIDLDGDGPVLAGRRMSLVAAAIAVAGDRAAEDVARSWVLTGGEEHVMVACLAGPAPEGWDVVGRPAPAAGRGRRGCGVDGLQSHEVGGWTTSAAEPVEGPGRTRVCRPP